MKNKVQKAIGLFKEYKLEEAQPVFEEIIEENPNDIVALLHLGKIYSRTQNYGEAMNFFSKVLELESDNSEAKTGLVLVQNILQLANNYYFENPYTDDDLYNL